MSSGKGQHRLDGSKPDETWAGRMKRDLRPELADDVALDQAQAFNAAQQTAENLIGPPPPQAVSDPAGLLAADHRRFSIAAQAYNQERAAAYQTFRMASDAAWTEYHRAMRQANEEYESAVNAAAAHYDLAVVPDAKS